MDSLSAWEQLLYHFRCKVRSSPASELDSGSVDLGDGCIGGALDLERDHFTEGGLLVVAERETNLVDLGRVGAEAS